MKPKASPGKPAKPPSPVVMVTFGRGSAELKRNFDMLAKKDGYTKAGFALALIREGVERRLAAKDKKPN